MCFFSAILRQTYIIGNVLIVTCPLVSFCFFKFVSFFGNLEYNILGCKKLFKALVEFNIFTKILKTKYSDYC